MAKNVVKKTATTAANKGCKVAKELPQYVIDFKDQYESFLAFYKQVGMGAFVAADGSDSPQFENYANAIRTVIKIKMNTGKKPETVDGSENGEIKTNLSSNRSMVESLRRSGEYAYDKIYRTSKIADASDKNIKKEDDSEGFDELYANTEDIESTLDLKDESVEDVVTDDATVYIRDDVLDCLFSKVIAKEKSEQYYLAKEDATHAFNSIKFTIHNELVDLCRKLPKAIPVLGKSCDIVAENKDDDETSGICDFDEMPNNNCNEEELDTKADNRIRNNIPYYQMISLDAPIVDSEGNETLYGETVAAPSSLTKEEEVTLYYGKSSFIHEVISDLLKSGKPHYMLSYLNAVVGGTGKELYNDIHNLGYKATLEFIITDLKYLEINVDYLSDIKFNWYLKSNEVKRNDPIDWKYEAYKVVKKKAASMEIY